MPNYVETTIKSKDGLSTLLYDDTSYSKGTATIETVLSGSRNTYGITELSTTVGGTPIAHNTLLRDVSTLVIDVYQATLYDVTPEPEPETITGFYLDGQEYVLGGSGGITNDTTGTTSSMSSIWVGTETEYTNLNTKNANTLYFTF